MFAPTASCFHVPGWCDGEFYGRVLCVVGVVNDYNGALKRYTGVQTRMELHPVRLIDLVDIVGIVGPVIRSLARGEPY